MIERLSDFSLIDLAVEYYPGMPYIPATPPFQYGLTREHGDHVLAEGLSSAADQIVMSLHTGTHIDAFCHYARSGRLFGGVEADVAQNKWRGFCTHGVHEISPVFRRGVLLDVAQCLEVGRMAPGQAIGAQLLERAERMAHIEVKAGDCVLIRTGDIQLWPSQEYYGTGRDGVPGLDLEGARWLSERRVHLVGCDNYAVEQQPMQSSGRRAKAMPVHGHLLVDKGIYLLEVLNLEELSTRRAYEFTFIALPLKIRGATGSPVRPIALIEAGTYQ